MSIVSESFAAWVCVLADIYAADGEEFNANRQREEWEDERRQERERKEFLERKYRHRLQQELGTPVNPADFAPPPPPAPADDDLIAAGHDAPPEAPAFDLGTELHLYSTITEKAVYISDRDRGLAELLLEMKAES